MGSPFGGGGGNSVTVNIGGNAVQLQTAAQQASAALGNVGSAAQSAANTTGSAMRQAAASFDQLTQSIKYLQQAQVALGASQAQGDAAFLNEAKSAQDYADRLKLLQSSLALFNAQQQQTASTAQQTGSSLEFNVFGRITGWIFSFNQLVDGARNLKSVLDTLGSTAFGVFNTLSFGIPGALISGVGMLQQYAGQAMGMLQQYGVPLGPQGIASSFQLNMTTEKTRTGWGYLFGGGGQMQRTGPYAGQIIDPSGVAESMMLWSSQESMRLPFTRQDMMAAMTQLGLVPKDRTTGAHLSAAEIEHYLPILSDIAATYGSTAYGGQGINLQRAAYAVRMSAEGMARMLKMDLNINPEELIHYGLKARGSGYAIHITDPSTLLPALENFARAKGISAGRNDLGGASMMMEVGTFGGAWSSFVDRLQNFGLMVGGTDLSGNIRQGSLFGRMKQDLNTVSAWMDDPKNAAGIGKLADTVQGAMGGGVTVIGGVLGGVFQGMSQSGTGNTILDDLGRFSAFLRDPQTQDALRNFGDELGHVVGPALQTASKAVAGFFQGFGNSGAIKAVENALGGLGKWFSDPSHQADIQNITTAMGNLAGQLIDFGTAVAQYVAPIIGGALTALGQGQQNYENGSIPVIGGIQQQFNTWGVNAMSPDQWKYITTHYNPYDTSLTQNQRQMVNQAETNLLMQRDAGDIQKLETDLQNYLEQERIAWEAGLSKTPVTAPGVNKGNPRSGVWLTGPRGERRAAELDAILHTPEDYTKKGKDAGTAYLAGFQSAMQTSTTPTTAVNAYIAQFDAKIAQAGDPLAAAIADYVNRHVQQEIAAALKNYSGNGDIRQAGGYVHAPGIGPGYR